MIVNKIHFLKGAIKMYVVQKKRIKSDYIFYCITKQFLCRFEK